jgi:DNA-binding transcriptional MerR regulator
MGKPPKVRFWRAGELAKAVGVSTDTLRHYERKGILRPQRSHNGYREYSEEALERVRMVRQAMAVGFTLDELSMILRVFDQGGAPCHAVRNLAVNKLAEIDKHLQDVIALRNELRESLKDWDAKLAKTTSGKRAGLLKSLAARESVRHKSTSFILRKPKLKRKGKKDD